MDPKQLPPRDLVMKGGITSGVIYPGAVTALAARYRFRKLGGSSAGAIAAAVTAAAEYGRQTGRGTGMDQLARVTDDLAKPGFLFALFQPTDAARPLWEIVLALAQRALAERRRGAGLAVRAAAMAIRRRPARLLPAVLAVTLVAAAIGAAAALGPPDAFGWVLLGVLGLLAVAGGLAYSAGLALVRLVRETHASLPDSEYGLCPGSQQRAEDPPALVEWLHAHIQAAAGRGPDDPPLTFADLEAEGIGLAMTTTDLSYARPVPVPLPEETYMFEAPAMLRRFPRSVVAHMVGGPAPDLESSRLHWMPGRDLPVVVGVRLSLSFPLLLSAMPLHAYWLDPTRVNLFSDGGICSNFPIHFFDAWFPQTPTFGFDLVEGDPGEPRVGDPAVPAPPRWSQVGSLGQFTRQMVDAMQNWRDALQTELPGFRDRVVQVPLGPGEGGLNLQMTAPQIKRLMSRGAEAADRLDRKFDWERHRFVRYLTLMQLVQRNLRLMAEPAAFPDFADELAAGVPDVDVFRDGHDADWCRHAGGATAELLELAAHWAVDFDGPDKPQPVPTMRVVPPA